MMVPPQPTAKTSVGPLPHTSKSQVEVGVIIDE